MDDENREIIRGEGHIPIQREDHFSWWPGKAGPKVDSIRYFYDGDSNILWQEIRL